MKFKHVVKIVPWVLVAALVAFGIGSLKGYLDRGDQISDYERQVSGLLTEKEQALQQFNKELGLAQSKLVRQQELIEILKQDNEVVSQKFKNFVAEYDLKIRSRDRTIASLKQQLNGTGETEIIVSDECSDIGDRCVISYTWEDELKRFKLADPNIFKQGDEVFTSNQLFKIYGTVWAQRDGALQTRKLSLKEVYRTADGGYAEIPGAESEIVSSEFAYDNEPIPEEIWEWSDIFTLNPVIISSVRFLPLPLETEYGLGLEILGYEPIGIGLNTHISFNFRDISESGLYLGLSYSPKFLDDILNRSVNFALSASIGTTFSRFGRDVSVKVGVLFYLWN